MFAKIYQPAKTAMQSGKARTSRWVLEFEISAARRVDPLMGWTSSEDMLADEVRLYFDTKESAIAYAEGKNIPYRVSDPRADTPVFKAYSDNFAFRRRKPWTH